MQPGFDASEEPLSARERAAVIHRIRMLVEFWGITPEELEQDLAPSEALPAEPPRAFVKYRHPESGATWDGHGPHPQWLRDALLKEGFTVEQLKPESTEP